MGAFNVGGPTDVVVLHHYMTKSFSESIKIREYEEEQTCQTLQRIVIKTVPTRQ